MTNDRNRVGLLRPGAVSRFNDNTKEYAIAGARLAAFVAVLAEVTSIIAFTWTVDVRWAVTAGVVLLVGACAGWFGFVEHPNEEWIRAKTNR
jgi:fatty acid desaturase